MRHLVLPASLLLAAAASLPARAAESYDGCRYTITSLPATLTTQGVWCLKSDLATAINTGVAVEIAANNVTLDCNHFKIGGLAADAGTMAVGVRSQDRSNTTVRNCNIRGFRYGLHELGGVGHLIENNRFEGNTYFGIRMEGSSSLVRGNRVLDTGYSADGRAAHGIQVDGETDVIDNTIAGVYSSGDGLGSDVYGIITGNAFDSTISGNRIRQLEPGRSGVSFGIYNLNSMRIIVEGNHVVDAADTGGIGIRCVDTLGHAVDNRILGFGNPIVNCISSGNTVD